MVGKKIKEKLDSGIILKNNEMKDIMKVIKSLEIRGILLNRTARKINVSGLLSMKNTLKRLAKSVLLPLGLTPGASATDAAIQ